MKKLNISRILIKAFYLSFHSFSNDDDNNDDDNNDDDNLDDDEFFCILKTFSTNVFSILMIPN